MRVRPGLGNGGRGGRGREAKSDHAVEGHKNRVRTGAHKGKKTGGSIRDGELGMSEGGFEAFGGDRLQAQTVSKGRLRRGEHGERRL